MNEHEEDRTLVLQLPVDLIIRGQVSGRLYRFRGAGSSLPVDWRDAPTLLKKIKKRRSCCGGAGLKPLHIFTEHLGG